MTVKMAGGDASVSKSLLKEVTAKLTAMKKAAERLQKVEDAGAQMARGKEQAFYYRNKVVTAMNELRLPADELEKMVDKEFWPFPTYSDLLFEV